MFIHGFNNGISVLNDIIVYAAGEKAAEYVGPVFYSVWLILAAWGLAYLLFKKKLIMKREKKLREPYALSFGMKLLLLLPGFFIPICILIALTAQTVVPI
jgi:heme/copper-type cytochrome/quinol oxidase subunit 2